MKKTTLRTRRGEWIVFLLPVILTLGWDLLHPPFVNLGPDARLYLSVADNFLSTGHFIQSAREIEGMVVPFGLPLILTVLRAVRLPVAAVIVLQHFLLGAECLLLYRAEANRFGRGGLAPAVFCLALLRTHLALTNIYLEFYYLFFLCRILELLSREDLPPEKKLPRLNLAAFGAFAIRPVLAAIWRPILLWTGWSLWKKRLRLRRLLLPTLLIGLLLLGNAGVNHRETGHWILTENYSGEDMYTANNPAAKTDYYVNRDQASWVDEQFYRLREDPELDYTQQNAALKKAAAAWVRENPGRFLQNTGSKLVSIFLRYWYYLPLAGLALCLIRFPGEDPARRRRELWELLVNLALAVLTACGLIMGRYTLPVWPLTALHLAGGGWLALDRLGKLRKKRGA